jgi:hypothetical protein
VISGRGCRTLQRIPVVQVGHLPGPSQWANERNGYHKSKYEIGMSPNFGLRELRLSEFLLQMPFSSVDRRGSLSRLTRPVDESILNVPINWLYDIADIPYSEVQDRDSVAGSLFFGGNWWMPSATNLWGMQRGDSTHISLGPRDRIRPRLWRLGRRRAGGSDHAAKWIRSRRRYRRIWRPCWVGSVALHCRRMSRRCSKSSAQRLPPTLRPLFERVLTVRWMCPGNTVGGDYGLA